MVSWIILDPSTFYAYHCTYGYHIYLYVVADHVDLIFVFVSGSDKCEFI